MCDLEFIAEAFGSTATAAERFYFVVMAAKQQVTAAVGYQ